ncbi:hypothetical protein BpHYR1_027651 [Brachionus plicatilis]|uniref:Uncharacterized protein n=1 Tax=Brachionus plicatilis TaxID=10195 RepID=A0A3M7S3U3_BRAPC|nr:hypothetical protein BpHYR1_027651 [Brachionus plicatilis]
MIEIMHQCPLASRKKIFLALKKNVSLQQQKKNIEDEKFESSCLFELFCVLASLNNLFWLELEGMEVTLLTPGITEARLLTSGAADKRLV